MLTIAVLNQKGGVGKSTTVLGLASAALNRGLRVLVLDVDPQANSTAILGVTGDGNTMNDILYSDAKGCAANSLWDTAWSDNVKAIPSTRNLADREKDSALGIELRLRKALDSDTLRENFDLCLIDCPPSVGRLVSNALIAADHALVVTEPGSTASQGVAEVLQSISTVQEHYNSDLTLAGVVINKVPPRSREAEFRIRELKEHLGDQVWEPHMPVRTALNEAQGNGVPIHQHTPKVQDVLDIYDGYLDRLLAMRADAGWVTEAVANG